MPCDKVKVLFQQALSRVTEGFECIEFTFNDGRKPERLPIYRPYDNKYGINISFPQKGKVRFSCPDVNGQFGGLVRIWDCSSIQSIDAVKC